MNHFFPFFLLELSSEYFFPSRNFQSLGENNVIEILANFLSSGSLGLMRILEEELALYFPSPCKQI